MVRRIGTLLLFTAAAGAAAWGAWPGSASHAAMVRADIIGAVLLLAGLPLLSRWLLGPPGNRMARWLRAGCYAANLALMPAWAASGCSWARCREEVTTCTPSMPSRVLGSRALGSAMLIRRMRCGS